MYSDLFTAGVKATSVRHVFGHVKKLEITVLHHSMQ